MKLADTELSSFPPQLKLTGVVLIDAQRIGLCYNLIKVAEGFMTLQV